MDNKTLWIVKLDGRKQKYKREKLIKSLEQTFIATDIELSEYTNDKINKIANYVEDQVKDRSKVPAEEVSSLVEKGLMNLKGDYKTVAKQYILYRDERTRMRGNTTDKTVNEIVNGTSDYWTSENSNKNAMLASTQRDYLAGCISEDISRRQLLPTDVVKAHDEGIIHVHDIDYLVQKIHNCFASSTEFVTRAGVRSFASCKDGELVEVLDKDGHWRQAVVHYYGKQRLYDVTLETCTSKKIITCTQNHRWILKDGTVTTNLQEGDSLYALHVAESFGFEPMLMSPREKEMFTLGFILGDGNDYKFGLHVRLCGAKVQYAKIFEDCGYSLVSIKGSDDLDAYKPCKLSKQAFLATAGWHYLSGTDKEFLFKGFYAADGSATRNQVATANEDILRMICEISAIAGYHISSIATVTHDTNFKKDAILHTVYFRREQKSNMLWKVVSIKPHRRGNLLQNVWCVEEPITHSFTLAGGVVTGNCCLVNLEDMLQNGTVINGTLIEKPHSFSTACNIATQIMACIASGQYGK